MKLRRFVAACAAVVIGLTGFVTQRAEATPVDVYGTPGVHLVNGRYWRTTCEHYSSTVIRCTTDIFATKVFKEDTRWYKQNTWAFNNLSYLPSPRANWAGNPLAVSGSWTSTDGRQWRSECDSAATGQGACRHYIVATVGYEVAGAVKTETKEVFNSMVRFSSSGVPAVTSIPVVVPTGIQPPTDGPKIPLRSAGDSVPTAPPVPKPAQGAPAPSGSANPLAGGECPSTHPIKGNANSGIYHVPGQRYYRVTKAEECFAKERDAVAAGYRKSKV